MGSDDSIQQNIRISAVGGSEAAGEVSKVTNAFQDQKKVHDDIKEKFAQKLEHVGVQTFGTQLLHLAGIHSYVGPMMGVMKLAVGETAAAFGIATGPVGLMVFSLGALAAIYHRVNGAQEKHSESLAKQIKALEESAGLHGKTLDTLDKYEKAYGSLSPQLQTLRTATEDLLRAEARLQLIRLEGEIPALQKLNVELQKNADISQRDAAGKTASIRHFEDLALKQKEGSAAFQHYKQSADLARKGLEDLNVTMATKNQKLAESNAKLAEAKAQMDFLKSSTGAGNFMDNLAQSADKAEKATEKEMRALERQAQFLQKMHDREVALLQDAEKDVSMSFTKRIATIESATTRQLQIVDREFAQERRLLDRDVNNKRAHQEMLTRLTAEQAGLRTAIQRSAATKETALWAQEVGTIQSVSWQAFGSMAAGFGNAMGRMIVDGELLRGNFTKVIHDMKIMFISAVTEMIIKWLALKAVMGIASMGMSAAAGAAGEGVFTPVASSGTMVAAGGFEGVVDKPTRFLAGETPERVSITPMGGGWGQGSGGGGGGGGNVVNVVVNGISDPERIADKVGAAILRRVRGRGDVAFARGS